MELQIINQGMNGEGIAKFEGKTIFVNNAINGEIVEAEVIKDNKSFSFAQTTKVIQPSSNRTNPPCPYFNQCGGCDLQHFCYPYQLEFKQKLIKDTFKKILNLDLPINPTIPSTNQFEYRNKMSFASNNQKYGFYKTASNEIVEVENCMLANKKINNLYKIIKNQLKNHKIIAKNIVFRNILEKTLIGIVTPIEQDLSFLFKEFDPTTIGLWQIINTRKDSVVLSGKSKHIFGIDKIEINNFGINYSIDLNSFHQTNLDIQNKLYSAIQTKILPNSKVINGFSGAGLLSAIISKQAKHVYAIEIEKSSHQKAEELKHLNNIKNLTNICGDFFVEYKKLNKDCDTIILDPAKRGCGDKVMKAINGIQQIIYVSCNPIALCKDLRNILNAYTIESITPFDMFPNTTSVETLVILNKKS